MRTWIIIGAIAAVLIGGTKILQMVRARRKRREKAAKVAEQAAARAAREAEARRLEALKVTETAEQLALAEAAIAGDTAAREELNTTKWYFHANAYWEVVDWYFQWHEQGPALLESWRAAIVAGDIKMAITLARRYQPVGYASRTRDLAVHKLIVALLGVSPSEVREQTLAARDAWLAAKGAEAVAGSLAAYKALKQYRYEHRTRPGNAADDYPFSFPEGWNQAVTLHEPVPDYGSFSWRGREFQAGEPRLEGAKALVERDLTAALMIMAWYNWQTGDGVPLKGPFQIESELRAQLALLIEELRAANAPVPARALIPTETA